MTIQTTLDRTNLLELVRTLTPLQRQLLLKLSQKGASLQLELAMSVFKFPEDIRAPLQQLREAALVMTTNIEGGSFGAESFDLSDQGRQVVRLLRDPALQAEIAFVPPAASALSVANAVAEQRPTEAELLEKLGDAAMQQGDAHSALDYYKQALEITRGRAHA